MKRLKGEADEDQGDAGDAHALCGDIVGDPFDQGRCGSGEGCDEADGEACAQTDRKSMGTLSGDETGEVASDSVADGAVDGGEEYKTVEAWALLRIVEAGGADIEAIGGGLRDGADGPENDAEARAEEVRCPDSEAGAADGAHPGVAPKAAVAAAL